MSVAEMKLEAISKITTTDDEAILQKVLELLESELSNDTATNLNKNYDAINAQYGSVLQKLAQENGSKHDFLPHVDNILKERNDVLKKLGK